MPLRMYRRHIKSQAWRIHGDMNLPSICVPKRWTYFWVPYAVLKTQKESFVMILAFFLNAVSDFENE